MVEYEINNIHLCLIVMICIFRFIIHFIVAVCFLFCFIGPLTSHSTLSLYGSCIERKSLLFGKCSAESRTCFFGAAGSLWFTTVAPAGSRRTDVVCMA